jgi:hypothetical protein
MTPRELEIYCARVYLAQARHIRNHPHRGSFHAILLQWAANRRRAAAASQIQKELF